MKVYNAFLKIAKKNIGTIIMFIAISVGISSITAKFGSRSNTEEIFNSTKVETAVVDRDHTATSQAIHDYVAETQILVEIQDDKEVFQDELYYRNITNIIIIPENFETDLIAGKDPQIQCITVPGSFYGTYIKMQLDQYLNLIRNYLSLDVTPEDAQVKALELMNQKVPVTMQHEEHASTTVPPYYNYFQFMPYAILGIMISILGMILLAFNTSDLRKRNICSALSLRRQNTQLGLGCFTLAMIVLLILYIIPCILYGTDMLSDSNYIYLILNSISCMLVGTALGFLTGTISKKDEHVAIFSNMFALSLNFLGGIFVPLSIMGDDIQKIIRFIPTYWYSTTMDILTANTTLTQDKVNHVLFALLVQCVFAIAIFGITLVITRQKSKSE